MTGGFGFIGSHLVKLLLHEQGTRVHVVDDLSTSPCPLDYMLQSIGSSTKLSYDVCTVEEYFEKGPARFDGIFHLASPVGPAGVLLHAGEMVRSVVRDTYLVSDYCLAHSVRLVDVSTSEVYGGGRDGYCSEEDAKIVPAQTSVRLEYAVAKLAAETFLINSSRVKGLDARIVRPFNVAGPRQSPRGGFVLPRFLRQAIDGYPLTVFGNGSALRAFTHVSDLAAGIALAMTRGLPGREYNLGNPANKISVDELADRVIRLIGEAVAKEYIDPQEIYGPLYSEANDKFPDARRAMTELSWKPEYDIDAIIMDAYQDVLEQRRLGIDVPLNQP